MEEATKRSGPKKKSRLGSHSGMAIKQNNISGQLMKLSIYYCFSILFQWANFKRLFQGKSMNNIPQKNPN